MRKLLFFTLAFVFLMAPSTAFAKKRIEVNIPTRTLKLYDDNRFIKMYPIAVGRPSKDSPIGHYRVITKAVNPTWYPKGKKPVSPGPANPLGTRWIGFFRDYGIHGNNDPKSIGTFASKGCIRMQIYDVEELFDQVGVGADVDIYYNTMFPYTYADKNLNTLVIYPDLYNRKVNQLWKVDSQLENLGVLNEIPTAKKQILYRSVNNKTVAFSKNWVLFINNQFVSSDTRLQSDEAAVAADRKSNLPKNERVLVNLNDINSYFSLDLKVNSEGILQYDNRPIYYENINGVTYAAVLDLVRGIEGYFETDESIEKINWVIYHGSLNGKFVRLETRQVGHEIYASVDDIANALGYPYRWSEEKGALIVNGQEIRGKNLSGKMFITRKEIKQYFGVESKYYSIFKKMELYK